MPESQPAILPRRIAIRLLEAAQNAGSRPLRLLITCEVGAEEPEDIELPELNVTWEQVIEGLFRRDRKLWAIFQYTPTVLTPPAVSDCAVDLCLVASLDVPGVLQIHAWRRTGNIVREVPVQITP